MSDRLVSALGFLMTCIPMMSYAANGDWMDNTGSDRRIIVADKGADLPLSRDSLFDSAPEPTDESKQASTPATKDELFALEPAADKPQQEQPDAGLPATRDTLFSDEIPVKEAGNGGAILKPPTRYMASSRPRSQGPMPTLNTGPRCWVASNWAPRGASGRA